MKPIITSIIIGALLVLPFALLEAITTAGYATYGFPAALFAFMWLMASVLTALLISIVRGVRSGKQRAGLVLKTVLILAIAVVGAGLLNDQMPCFMGVHNCD